MHLKANHSKSKILARDLIKNKLGTAIPDSAADVIQPDSEPAGVHIGWGSAIHL
jgi:hypothetical protein